MNRDVVHIREIQIHRALGIRGGEGFIVSALEPGINLIFGPNGSGKSTTCRVAQELLWPGRLQRPTVSGIIVDGDDEWRIDIDAGHVQSHRNGRLSALPEFGSRENRARYLLGLKELIIDDSSDFAKAIADASQGGYDLDKAADDLGFRSRPKSRKSECDRVQAFDGDVEKARRIQVNIEREAARFVELRKRLDAAIEAGGELELLRKAREYHDARNRCRELKVKIDAFPAGVARLQGDERKQLDALAAEKKVLVDQQQEEEDRREEARRELERLRLPQEGVPDEHISELRTLRRAMRDVELRLVDLRRRRDEAVGIASEAHGRLGDQFSEEQLTHIELLGKSDIGDFAGKVHRLRAKEEVLAERRSWLEEEEPEETRALPDDELREGIGLLTRWLSSPTRSNEARHKARRTIGAMVLLVAAIAGLALAAAWLWAIVVFVAAALVALDWWSGSHRSGAATTNSREVYRASYSTLPLPEPDAWNEEAVMVLLRNLIRLNSTKALFRERRTRLDQMRSEENALHKIRSEVEDQRRKLEADLGLSLEITEEWIPVLVDNIREWQKARSQVAAAEGAYAEPKQQRNDLERRINRLLAEYGYEPVQSSDAADENIADLERRRNSHDSALDVLERSDRRLDGSIIPALERLASRRSAIFERLGIGEDQESVLDEWLARYPAYRELKESFAKEDAVCSDRAAALAERPDLVDLDPIQMDRRLEACKAAADSRDDLSQTIGEITRQIKDAKAGHSLSDALEQRDDAVVDLAEARDENCGAVAGATLIEWVRREAVERSRPQVFRRANELFVRFTHGTMQLEMDDRATPPAFVARRSGYPVQSLNELSDGERIQLMTAVRLAFLEQDEARRLPLLVDEVLGTSDDGRSGVLIDTMIAIARQGRQVFYCTAQHDELGKWKARLEEANMPFKIVDLGDIREGMTRRAEPLEIALVKSANPLEPGTMSYEEYGEALGVPALTPQIDSVDGVHLWHFLDDSSVLFELLSKDIRTWGQLQTLLAHGGAGLVEMDDRTISRASAVAKAMRCVCEALKIGRGKPVDRRVLLDSACVSDRFIDEVAGLAQKLDGDADAIIRALDARVVSNWRSDNTDRLRELWEEEGYLCVADPLPTHEIRIRALAAVSGELNAGILEESFIDGIVGGMCRGTVVDAEAA